MSEFKIIKCKSCDAALVELEGQRLNKCIQCGHDFAHRVNKKAKLESLVEQTFEKKFENKTAHSTQTIQNSQSNQQTPKQAPVKIPKNPASIIVTIIKWYIIIAVLSGILKAFF